MASTRRGPRFTPARARPGSTLVPRAAATMPSLTITTRKAKDGARYVVRYRLGGRACPIVHAGSFRTLKEAKARRDLVAGELVAGGRNPAEALRALSAAPTAVVSVEHLGGEVPHQPHRRRREHDEELPLRAAEGGGEVRRSRPG